MSNSQYSTLVHRGPEPEAKFGGASDRGTAQSVWERPAGWPMSGDALAALNGHLHAAARATRAASKRRASADAAGDSDTDERSERRLTPAEVLNANLERERRAAGHWPDSEYTPLHLFAEPDTNEALRQKVSAALDGVRGRTVLKHRAETTSESLRQAAIRMRAIEGEAAPFNRDI